MLKIVAPSAHSCCAIFLRLRQARVASDCLVVFWQSSQYARRVWLIVLTIGWKKRLHPAQIAKVSTPDSATASWTARNPKRFGPNSESASSVKRCAGSAHCKRACTRPQRNHSLAMPSSLVRMRDAEGIGSSRSARYRRCLPLKYCCVQSHTASVHRARNSSFDKIGAPAMSRLRDLIVNNADASNASARHEARGSTTVSLGIRP
jgi:hypothetical protein